LARPRTVRLADMNELGARAVLAPNRQEERHADIALRWLISSSADGRALTLMQQIAADIGKRIVLGHFPPGAPLPEQDLSQTLSVSRGPIREALRILEREGLVKITARRGAYVSRLSVPEVHELFEIRELLFGRIAYRSAQEKSAQLLQRLDSGLLRLKIEAGPKGTADGYALETFSLTLDIARDASNAQLRDMVVSLALRTLRYSKLGFASAARRRESFVLWQRLVVALRRGDGNLAQHLVERHVRQSCRLITLQLTQLERKGGAVPADDMRIAA
jgi:DNA-binding GntR family transcriptional regulator